MSWSRDSCAFLTLAASLVFGVSRANAASLVGAPPSFQFSSTYGAKAVFVDFTSAHYELNAANEILLAKSTIQFTVNEEGFPLFDLVDAPDKVWLDGEIVAQKEISSPDNETKYRVILKAVKSGPHSLVIFNRISRDVSFNGGELALNFDFDDMAERHFLERYLPTSFEFDQYKMTLDIRANNAQPAIFTNGRLKSTAKNVWRIEFPGYFNCASPFLNFGSAARVNSMSGVFRALNGKAVPVTVFKARFAIFDLAGALRDTITTLAQLEREFGPYPNDTYTLHAINGLPREGMEYAGAATAVRSVIAHEVTHSYFARGVLPANGNAGWIDEAIATWREKNYRSLEDPRYESANLGNFSPYRRRGTLAAYWKGERFIAYLDYKFRDRGGMRAFLRAFFMRYRFRTITTESFRRALEAFFHESLRSEFDRRIYGR